MSPKNEREAPGFRHGEESGCDDRRLELKSIGIAIFFVNRFAIFMTNSCYSSRRCGDVERTGCAAKNSSHIGADLLACCDGSADNIARRENRNGFAFSTCDELGSQTYLCRTFVEYRVLLLLLAAVEKSAPLILRLFQHKLHLTSEF